MVWFINSDGSLMFGSFIFFLMIRRPPRSTPLYSSAASDVYKRQALACDFKIAATSARLGSATLRFGLLPDEGGQYLLMQHLGLAKTMDFIMRKRIVDAEEAMSLGLVNSVVPDNELRVEAAKLAEEFANGPQVAMRMMKRSIYQAAELTFDQACDEIAAKTAVTDHHPDTKEGVSAFHEKRAPAFNAWLKKTQ